MRYLPSRAYLKLLFWTNLIFFLILAILFYLFGQYLGYEIAWIGVLLISVMLFIAFSGVLICGVILYFIDPE
jgi:hypothetical protein